MGHLIIISIYIAFTQNAVTQNEWNTIYQNEIIQYLINLKSGSSSTEETHLPSFLSNSLLFKINFQHSDRTSQCSQTI